MKYITVALPVEAKPIKQYFSLKKAEKQHRFTQFAGNHGHLIVSGVGNTASAIATTYMLSSLDKPELENAFAINIGLAGCPDPSIEVGSAFLINRVVDYSSSHEYFPEQFVKSQLTQTSCISYAKLQTKESLPESHSNGALIDMEAAGFMQAAASFLPRHRIIICKIVSDHLEGEHLSRVDCEAHMANCLSELAKYIDNCEHELSTPQEEIFNIMEQAEVKHLCAAWHLTKTQQMQLRDALCIYHFKHKKPPSRLLTQQAEEIPLHKQRRNQSFKSLLELIHQGDK